MTARNPARRAEGRSRVPRMESDPEPNKLIHAREIISRGDAHADQGAHDAAIMDYTSVVESFSNDQDSSMREQVARALAQRGNSRGQRGLHAAAIADYTLVVTSYSADTGVAIRLLCVTASASITATQAAAHTAVTDAQAVVRSAHDVASREPSSRANYYAALATLRAARDGYAAVLAAKADYDTMLAIHPAARAVQAAARAHEPTVRSTRVPMSYEDWNLVLAEYFFSGSYGYRPVRIDIDDELLKDLADGDESAATTFVAAVGSTIEASNWDYDAHRNQLAQWRRTGSAFPPPFVALLALFSLTANRMHASGEIASNNYYTRLAELLAQQHSQVDGLADRFRARGADASFFWDELNGWLIREQNQRGIPTAYPFGGYVHVSRNVSQALVRDSDRQTLVELFSEYALDPQDDSHGGVIRELLIEWSEYGRLSASLKNLIRGTDALEAIVDEVSDLLSLWDGIDPRSPTVGSSTVREPRWRLVVRPERLPGRPLPEYKAFFAARDESGRLAGRYSLRSGISSSDVTIGPSFVSGWSETEGRSLFDLPNELQLKSARSSEVFTWKPDNHTVWLRSDPDELMGFVETNYPVGGERYLVMVGASGPPWRGQSDLKTGSWTLYRDVECPEDAEVRSTLHLVGGLRISRGNTFHRERPPRIEIRNLKSGATLLVERVGTTHRNEYHLIQAPSDPIALDELAKQAGDGLYRAMLVGTRTTDDGERSGVLARERFHLVSASSEDGDTEPTLGYRLASVIRPGALDVLPYAPTMPFIRGGEAQEVAQEHPVSAAAVARCQPGVPRGWVFDPPIPSEQFNRPGSVSCPDCGNPIRVENVIGSSTQISGAFGRCMSRAPRDVVALLRDKPVPVQDTASEVGTSWRRARGVVEDQFIVGATDYDTPTGGDVLLDALGYLGSGSALQLRRLLTVGVIPTAPWAATELLQRLEALGHVELERDSDTDKVSAWQIAPSVLTAVADGDLWMLSGLRSNRLLAALEHEAPLLHFKIHRYQNRSPIDPPIVMLTAKAIIVSMLVDRLANAHQLFVRIQDVPLALPLLQALPRLSLLAPELPRALAPGSSAERFNLDTLGWTAETGISSAAYRVSALPSRHTIKTFNGYRHADVRLAKYFAASSGGMTLLLYDGRAKNLSVPESCPLPSLYERALVSCSGLLPLSTNGRLIYKVVPRVIAKLLADRLEMSLASQGHKA